MTLHVHCGIICSFLEMKITHCACDSSSVSCSPEGSFYVANGALMIEPVTAVPAFIAQGLGEGLCFTDAFLTSAPGRQPSLKPA